jgi:hypothetical protein
MDQRSSLGREILLLWLVGLGLAGVLLASDVAMHGSKWDFFMLLPNPQPTFLDIGAAVMWQLGWQRPMTALALVGVPLVLVLATIALLLASLLRRRPRATA